MKKILNTASFLVIILVFTASCGSGSDKKNDAVVDATDSIAVDDDVQPNTGCD